MKLTHIACKNAEPRKKAYKLSDGGGVYLYVMPNGSKYWHFKYHYAGKEKRLAMGVYPEISLQMAREKRLKARRLLDEGIDPGIEKKRMKYQRIRQPANFPCA